MSSTFIPFVAGAGMAVGSALAGPSSAHAVTAFKPSMASLPAAKPRPGHLQLVACNPCSPCAAKNPCNPCADKHRCNPCAAANPCGAANPCSPCGAGEPVEVTSEEAEAAYA